MTYTRFDGLPDGAKGAYLKWWHGFNAEKPIGQARADRAVLRRAGSLTAVACTAAYQRVYRDMIDAHGGHAPWGDSKRERIAAIVALAAHIKGDAPTTLPQAMGPRGDGSDRNPVSELRFLRLLDAPDIESLFNGLRRVLPLIEHKVDPASLADDVFAWGDRVKKEWAYNYAWPKKSSG